jgi:hypothetical protein
LEADLDGASLRVKDVVDHVAGLGGYANKYSGGRHAPTVLGAACRKCRSSP